MNIESNKGDKVVFTGEGGYSSDIEYVNKYLTVGKVYVIDSTFIHSSTTEVILVGYPMERFNSVHFDSVAESYHSEIIESLENKMPNPEDFQEDGFGNGEDYIDALLLYIERLKKDHAIELEMLTQALKENQYKFVNN